MSGKLFYLMTRLPSLPNLGEMLTDEDIMARVREESGENITLFADLLDLENEIIRCASEYFVKENREYKPDFSDIVPAEFVQEFMTFIDMPEAEWLGHIYVEWFRLIHKLGRKTHSDLLVDWTRWEYTLRYNMFSERMKRAGFQHGDSDHPPRDIVDIPGDAPDHSGTVAEYFTFEEPIKAEKYIDQIRIDYLRDAVVRFTFSVDELVAYMLEYRIHLRYAGLDPEKGRKILEEVTRL